MRTCPGAKGRDRAIHVHAYEATELPFVVAATREMHLAYDATFVVVAREEPCIADSQYC